MQHKIIRYAIYIQDILSTSFLPFKSKIVKEPRILFRQECRMYNYLTKWQKSGIIKKRNTTLFRWVLYRS